MNIKRDLILLYLFNFLKSLQFFGALAVPFFLHRLGMSYTRMFLLEMVFSAGMFIFEIPTGVIADRVGRKFSLFLGALLFGVGFALFGIFTSFWVLVGAEIICAIGMTMLSGADRALIFDTLKSSGREGDAARIFSRFDAFGTAGMLVAFPAGTLFAGSGLVSYHDALGLVFLATAAALLVASLIVLLVREAPCEKHEGSALMQGLNGFLALFRTPGLRIFSLNYAAISSMTFLMFWFYQSLLVANKIPVGAMGFVSAAFNLTAMLLLFLVPVIEKRVGVGRTLFLSSLVPGILYLGVAFIPGLIMAIAAIFGVTNLKMLRAPLLSARMNEQIESSRRATVLSGVSMMERILTTLLYPVAGLLADVSLPLVFLVMGLITIALSVLLRIEDSALV